MDRRHFLGGMGAATTAFALSSCSNGSSAGAPAGPAPTASSASTWTVRHRYGTTTVGGPPQRVVTLGQTDHDATIALGVLPVAVGGFLGSSYTPFRSWNDGGLTTTPPVLDMQEIAFEKVAALAPDRRSRAFLRLWCAREAVLKAMGTGLAGGLHAVRFAIDGGRITTPAWRVIEFVPARGYLGALVVPARTPAR